jgi:hypothetical protein
MQKKQAIAVTLSKKHQVIHAGPLGENPRGLFVILCSGVDGRAAVASEGYASCG